MKGIRIREVKVNMKGEGISQPQTPDAYLVYRQRIQMLRSINQTFELLVEPISVSITIHAILCKMEKVSCKMSTIPRLL
jgi:hypothetical protein